MYRIRRAASWPEKCARCGARRPYTMSYFNTDAICDRCEKKERKHPLYARAVEAENDAVRRSNFNFPGIGKPKDL